jgi:hypothetical protein
MYCVRSCAVLCYAVLSCAVLCCPVLCCGGWGCRVMPTAPAVMWWVGLGPWGLLVSNPRQPSPSPSCTLSGTSFRTAPCWWRTQPRASCISFASSLMTALWCVALCGPFDFSINHPVVALWALGGVCLSALPPPPSCPWVSRLQVADAVPSTGGVAVALVVALGIGAVYYSLKRGGGGGSGSGGSGRGAPDGPPTDPPGPPGSTSRPGTHISPRTHAMSCHFSPQHLSIPDCCMRLARLTCLYLCVLLLRAYRCR